MNNCAKELIFCTFSLSLASRSPFFSVVALVGLFVSTKVHPDGEGTEDVLSIQNNNHLNYLDDDNIDESSTHLI